MGLRGGNDTTAPHLDVRPPTSPTRATSLPAAPGFPPPTCKQLPRLKQDGFVPQR
jgi:hypothetical protein